MDDSEEKINGSSDPENLNSVAEQELLTLLSNFQSFLECYKKLESSLKTLPENTSKEFMMLIENRLAGKLLERRFQRSSAKTILFQALESVSEISGILDGVLSPPDKTGRIKNPPEE